jgi:recombination protein RecA
MTKELDTAVARIEKLFGKGALLRVGDTEHVPAEVISTGILSLDRAIRPKPFGGFPRGRIVELFGQEATGKTSIVLSAMAEAQKAGEICALIDAEHAFDRDHARRLGVDVDNLYISQPSNGEEGLEIADELVRSGKVAIVAVDSVAALVPKAELEGQMGDQTMALQARMMNQALRKLTGSVSKTNTCLAFVNQLRDKIGVFYGNPTVTTGGKGLKFYASLRLEVSRSGNIKDGEQIIGARTKIKVVKNKIAAPANICEVDLLFDRGFSKEGDLVDLCTENGLLNKSGAWYSTPDRNFQCQGRDGAIEHLRAYPDEAEQFKAKLLEKLNGN